MPRGGARQGAGRKKRAVTHERAINAAVKRCADRLPQLLETMERLAEGGFITPEDTYEPAGLQTEERTEIIEGANGGQKAVKKRVPLYPDKEPDDLVLVRRTFKVATPDRAAAEYLINRVMGTPTQKHEFNDLSDAELVEEAARLFGRADETGLDASESE